jgi:hypothetical protein
MGYKGIRGTLASKPCCANIKTLANGYNVLDMTSQGTFSNLVNLSYRDMRNYMAAYVWKNAAWGNPMGFFQHVLEIPPDQTQNELKALELAGATILSDTALMNVILGCYQSSITPNVGVGYTGNFVPGSFYTCPALATGKEMDFRPTRSSPTFNAGIPLGATFQYDINGINRTTSGIWSIGAYDQTNPPVPVPPGASLANRWCVPVANSFTGTVSPLLVQDGPAKPLQNCLYTEVSNTPSGGTVRPLTGGCSSAVSCPANLVTLINSGTVVCGDVITLDPAFTYDYSWANTTLNAKTCSDTAWITLKTSQFANLPDEHTRISPCWGNTPSLPGRPAYACPISGAAQILAKVIFGAGSNNLLLAADHMRFIGLEITRASGTAKVTQYIDMTGANSVIFDRNWIHGTALDETTHGIQLQTSYKVAFINNYLSDIHCISGGACDQSQAIDGGLGTTGVSPATNCQGGGAYSAGCPGIYKFVNNFVEAAGENMIFGGGGANFVPVDMEFRRNHFFKPLFWNQNCATDNGCGTPGSYLGTKFSVQNLFEVKNGARILFEDNILENNWGGFSQDGYASLWTPKNQNGVCPVCYVADGTVRYNIVTGAADGFQVAAVASDTGALAVGERRMSFHDIVIDGQFSDAKSTGYGLELTFACGMFLNDISFNHMSWVKVPHSFLLIGTSTRSCSPAPTFSRIQFTNSIMDAGTFPGTVTSGVTGCQNGLSTHSPKPLLDACTVPYTWNGNAVSSYNATYVWPTLLKSYTGAPSSANIYANYNAGLGGDYHVTSASGLQLAGTDGKDVGADITKIAAETAGVQ